MVGLLRRECVDTAAILIGSRCRRRDCLSVRSGVARQARRGSLGSERARTRRKAASVRSTRLPAVVDRGNVRVSTGRTAVSRLPHVDSVRCAGRVLGAVVGVNADGEGQDGEEERVAPRSGRVRAAI